MSEPCHQHANMSYFNPISNVYTLNAYGSGQEGAAVLLPGFAII